MRCRRWWPIYLEYQSQFEALLQSFVDEAGTTVSGFMQAAESAEGMNEIYLQIFLAHADYQMFVELMQAEFEKQQVAAEDMQEAFEKQHIA